MMKELHSKLNRLEQTLGENPDNEIVAEYEYCKAKINQIEDTKAEGNILRSKVDWVEKGERNTR